MENPTTYKSVIGALQYVTYTRPDLSFIINRQSQFLQSPTIKHWQAAKRVLRCLKGTKDFGLHIKPCDFMEISGFSYANWACTRDNIRSTEGYCVYFGDKPMSWNSKK